MLIVNIQFIMTLIVNDYRIDITPQTVSSELLAITLITSLNFRFL